MDHSKSDFTQGSILKKLTLFMIPVLGALILQAAYGAVDLLVVGRFGTTAGLSAVSTGSQVLNLITFVVTQFAMGITCLLYTSQEMVRVLKKQGHLLNIDGNHYYHYQDQDYSRAGHSDHQHMEGIDVSIIDNIAKELKLSYVLRPRYDIEILKEIGFQQVESQILSKEKTKEGKELIRQFLIHAIK